MAKKQTRRSISVSKATYERLKSFCETNGVSMSQFVERRVGDYLGRSERQQAPAAASVPSAPSRPVPAPSAARPAPTPTPTPAPAPAPARMPQVSRPVSALRSRVSPDEPQVKDPDQKLTADQIFTF